VLRIHSRLKRVRANREREELRTKCHETRTDRSGLRN
jgi:hypothetical protein